MLEKLKGGQPRPPRPSGRMLFHYGALGFIAIAVLGLVMLWSDTPLMIGSFGATCMILGMPDLPFAQPRHVIGGHVLSSLVGLLCLSVFGPSWWAMALAVALAIAGMHALRVGHPPAASNPVIIMLSHPGWGFLLFPTFAGSVILVLVALVYHNLPKDKSYPRYW